MYIFLLSGEGSVPCKVHGALPTRINVTLKGNTDTNHTRIWSPKENPLGCINASHMDVYCNASECH